MSLAFWYGSHEAHRRSLLQDREIRRLIPEKASMALEVKGLGWWARRKVGSRVRMVSLQTAGVVTRTDRLVGSIDLVRSVLEGVQRVGTAVRQRVEEEGNGVLPRRL